MPIKDPVRRRENHRRYMKEWYADNKQKHIQYVANRTHELRQWLKELKATLECYKCGESHVSCMDFHHRDPKEKEIGISQIFIKGWGKERILEEIAKCDVLCSNCHRKLHYDERTGPWKHIAG